MLACTLEQNRNMTVFDACEQVWLFGYGSLIFRPDFPFLAQRPARLLGHARRFWQASVDHRGTPQQPGRVVTLIEQAGAAVDGVAFLITPAVFAHLDERERNGYLRLALPLHFDDGSQVLGLTYVARQDNPAYLGPASEQEIAQQIARAHGPSGPNRDYLLQLAQALRALGSDDPHVFALERAVLQVDARKIAAD